MFKLEEVVQSHIKFRTFSYFNIITIASINIHYVDSEQQIVARRAFGDINKIAGFDIFYRVRCSEIRRS